MKVIITTATTDIKIGTKACNTARELSGFDNTPFVVSVDIDGVGSTKTGNKAWKDALAYNPDFLCYINDDVEINQQGWLKRMVEALETSDKYGLASPSGNCWTEPLRSGNPGMSPGIQIVNMLSFFCVVIKRDVLEQIGLLDEEFIHFGSDSDYCNRAIRAGWKCIWVRDVYVQHDFTPYEDRPEKVKRWKDHDTRLYKEMYNT